MEDFLETLERLPLSALAAAAKKLDENASLAQSREALVAVLVEGRRLPEDPMQIVRRRIHKLIAANYEQLAGLMDEECELCFNEGQQKCHDMRALVDYLQNLTLLDFEEDI